MAAHKFLFDNCFDDGANHEAEEEAQETELPPAPTFGEDDISAARAQGFVDGRTEGIAEMQAAIDQRISSLLADMAAQLDTLGEAQRATAREVERRTMEVAVAIARKIVPAVARPHAEDAIESVLRDCLPKLMDEPRIVIRVHPTVLEELRAKVDTLAMKTGFPGDIILLGDDDLNDTDCRVEWADGGAEKSADRVWAGIDDAVNAYFAALAPKRATTEAPTEVPGNAGTETLANDIPADGLAGQEVNQENANG